MPEVRKQKRSLRRVKWLGFILVVIIAVVLGCYAGISRKPPAHEIGDTDHEIVHVMIMGVDSRKDDVGRSDTLMVTSIDKTAEKAALLSIPRDTRVAIDGHGYDKINHAYAYGGHELTQKSVEGLLGVPMDHYVIIDTKSFERIIDAIGGVDIDVEKRMHYEDPWDDNGASSSTSIRVSSTWMEEGHPVRALPRRRGRHRAHRAPAEVHEGRRWHRSSRQRSCRACRTSSRKSARQSRRICP